jgi:hypothetical protein
VSARRGRCVGFLVTWQAQPMTWEPREGSLFVGRTGTVYATRDRARGAIRKALRYWASVAGPTSQIEDPRQWRVVRLIEEAGNGE